MLAHVKTPLIEIEIKGDSYQPLIDLLKKDFGENLKITEDTDDEFVNITDTNWYKETTITPGDTVKIHRKNLELTQIQLGKKLGNKSKQYVSDIEKGRRPISINLAKVLAKELGHNYKSYL